jgi:ATP-dependent Lhr-like helicase
MDILTPHGRSDPEPLGLPPAASAALAVLLEPFARWFQQTFGEPTSIQRLAWPAVAAGRHLLISAPTGSGKTLAALLPLLGRLVAPESETARLSASLSGLYVAPLKALANDTARNLQASLSGLAPFLSTQSRLPRLGIRTGDTPSSERRALRHDPPDVLLTTPESLALLLSQPALRGLFAELRWIVVDEVHDFAAGKRGADLALSLERLEDVAVGPVQRVGLSATATPLAEAARFLVGVGRPCGLAAVESEDALELVVAPLAEDSGQFLDRLIGRLTLELRACRSTLVFANTRRLAERLAWALRRAMPEWHEQIAVHHSSVAPERRRQVETCFKRGHLRAVVSSTSLELGIDMGPVDLVVLVHPPGDVVRLLQRVGRAGHGPGRVRRGLVLTTGPAELLEAAVTAASGRSAQCEPLRVPACPLDVLCQHLAGMAGARAWSAEEALALTQRSYPYRDLSRSDFDACLAYLFGLDPSGRPWLPARLRGDADSFCIVDDRTARLVRRNLGTILAEPVLEVRSLTDGTSPATATGLAPAPLEQTATLVGQVDQTYGEGLAPGDRFLLDGRCLELRRREANELLVDEVVGRPSVPRWGGEGWPLSRELARRLFLLRVRAAEALREGPLALATLLQRGYRLGAEAAAMLTDHFLRQENVSEIPDASVLLVEVVTVGDGAHYYLHTPLNRLANDALGRVAVHRLARDLGRPAVSVVADLGCVLQVRGAVGELPDALRRLLDVRQFDADLDAALVGCDALRERFRRVALTGLMLLRQPLGQRRRVGGWDWAGRRLFDKVRDRDPDFVLLRQARRELRTTSCDAAAARDYAAALPGLSVRVRPLRWPSPFAESWTQLGEGAAEAVETPAEALRRLHQLLTGGAASNACAG